MHRPSFGFKKLTCYEDHVSVSVSICPNPNISNQTVHFMFIELDTEVLYKGCSARVSFVRILSETATRCLKACRSFQPYCPHFLADLVSCGAQDLQRFVHLVSFVRIGAGKAALFVWK